jgi:RimJ/RimL family protein N-acetyltransferase
MIELARYVLKELSETDLPKVLKVYQQCEDFLALGPVPYASLEMVRNDFRHSRDNGGIFYGICDKQQDMIGVLDVVLAGFEGNEEQAFISLLLISAPHRNRGIGHAVLAAIEEHIKANPKVKRILSAVQTNNQRAIDFWQREGYAIRGEPQKQEDGTITYNLCKKI